MSIIKSIAVSVSCPGRNFVTVKITTEDGICGIGDATLNGRELAVASYLEEHIVPCLIGRDAQMIEDIWQYLYRGAYWRRGAVTMAAIAGIDMALWDIKGKIAGLPVYQLLGGKSRKGVTLYAHANGGTIEETLDKAKGLMDSGFTAIRLQSAIPDLPVTYGVLGDKKDYYALQGERPLPPEEIWSTSKYFKLIPELFSQARQVLGPDVKLLHDVHNRLTPVESARLGKLLEPYDLMFLEDPCLAENQKSLALIRQNSCIPLALGETYNSLIDCKEMIENQWIDYIRMAATHAGGLTALRRVTDFAAIYNVKTAPHGAPDLSPICFAAHLHLNLWAPNFGIQEYVGLGNKDMQSVFKTKIDVKDGMAFIGDAPGLGVDFDEEAAAAFPYKRSYLPVSRLEDGTMWNW